MKKINRRQFGALGLAAGAALLFPAPSLIAKGANEKIRIGGCGCGWRGGQILSSFKKLSDQVDIVALADPDPKCLDETIKAAPKTTKGYSDLRKIIDDPNIDAIFITIGDYWHALAAIWAMQAGKHVYVEKPLTPSIWEGRQIINATRKYKKICQLGTQQRSDPMQAEIKKFLYEEKGLGRIISARVNRYAPRPAIGKRTTPLELPADLDYNLWLGPAQDKPILRDKLHYDWHWDWNTGTGEMGNWGVHVMDDVLNIAFQDKYPLPKGVMAGGARLGLNDAGETPNVHFVYFDTGFIPVVIGLSNMAEKPNAKNAGKHPGPGSGYLLNCEGGALWGVRGKATAYDKEGKIIKTFKGDSGKDHQQNFIDAIRANDPSILNAEVAIGNQVTSWCNLANIAFRSGHPYSQKEAASLFGKTEHLWEDLLADTESLLKGRNIPMEGSELKLSPLLQIDAKNECFVGEGAQKANTFLKRKYRKPFVVPEIEL